MDKKWYNNLKKSKLTPPNWVFGTVWPILYITLAISFNILKNNKKCSSWCNPLTFFVIQMVFNLVWTNLFFKLKKIKLALLDLALVIIFTFFTMKDGYNINKNSTYILIPYFIWLLFAFYLNFYIVLNN